MLLCRLGDLKGPFLGVVRAPGCLGESFGKAAVVGACSVKVGFRPLGANAQGVAGLFQSGDACVGGSGELVQCLPVVGTDAGSRLVRLPRLGASRRVSFTNPLTNTGTDLRLLICKSRAGRPFCPFSSIRATGLQATRVALAANLCWQRSRWPAVVAQWSRGGP